MGPTVLIIDDSEDDILLTQMTLRKIEGTLTVETALSGEAGLARLRADGPAPSLVLLDLKMQGMDGFAVLRAMRADDRLRRIPVVVVTHSDLEADKQASFACGANSFLNKSVDLDQFTGNLRGELQKWI